MEPRATPLSFPPPTDAKAQVSSAALLSQEALRTVQVVATLGGPDSLLGQAQEARQWTEQLLWATGRPRGPAVLRLILKGLVNRVQRLSPRLLGLVDKAGVVGGNMGHWGMFCQGEDSPGTKLNVGPFKIQDTKSSLGPRSCWQGCRGRGPGLARVPVPSGVPSYPGTLLTSQWALIASRNSSRSLDIAAITLEQCQHLVQSRGVCGRGPGGVTGYEGLAMGSQEKHSTYGPPLPATADPGHGKLHRNPGLGGVAACKGALGRGHRISCAGNCAGHPAFPLGYMSACYVSVHC